MPRRMNLPLSFVEMLSLLDCDDGTVATSNGLERPSFSQSEILNPSEQGVRDCQTVIQTVIQNVFFT